MITHDFKYGVLMSKIRLKICYENQDFGYVVSDGCGYCKFNNTDDVDNFYSDLCELKDELFWLQCCYDKD